MKKIVTLLIALVTLFSMPAFAFADLETSLEVTPPDKLYYLVGEAPDYTGGVARYTAQTAFDFPLSAQNCAGFDTSAPGVKTVTVSQNGLQAYFNIVVFQDGEPISEMRDIARAHWAYGFLGACMKAGIFKGNDDQTIRADSPITRAEMAEIIYRSYQHDPRAMEESPDALPPFSDVQEESWYFEAVDACRKAGIIRGVDPETFDPESPITREDAVLMLMRIQYTDAEFDALDIEAQIAASGLAPADFDQVSTYARAAMALALGKVVFGDENGRLTPRDSITRGESAAIFKRLFMNDYEWVAPAEPVKTPLVYLSPSNQFANQYTGVDTTEGEQMYRVGEVVKRILEEQGYQVVMPGREVGIRDRSLAANEMGADVYLAIHSNAGGGTGTRGFYNGANPGSKEMSYEVFNRVAALTGTVGREPKEDYLCLQGGNGTPFIEVGWPKVANLLLEVEFHDNTAGAQWIVAHTEELGRAIAEGIIAYCETYVRAS